MYKKDRTQMVKNGLPREAIEVTSVSQLGGEPS